jgi:anti-sigma regulatory factor (Ser/Thr protein kinase)
VALVVTELVTNAVLHARSAPILTVAVGPSAIRVEVFDDGPGTPRLRPLGDEPVTSGRGLALVDMVAESWGVAPSGPGGAPGKTVWAVIAAG